MVKETLDYISKTVYSMDYTLKRNIKNMEEIRKQKETILKLQDMGNASVCYRFSPVCCLHEKEKFVVHFFQKKK